MLKGILLLSLLVHLACRAALAQDIILRAEARPTEAWVGQRVVVQVDVLGAQGWAQITRFADVDLAGAYLLRTETQGNRLQEMVLGTSYTGERYEFSMYPQRAGQVELPSMPIEVTVSTLGLNAKQTVHEMQTPALSISARVPPGADGIRGLISSPRLDASQQWTTTNKQVQVGDAVRRTITLTADDVSGMAFSPLQVPGLPGVGSYPAEPDVEDSVDRGSLVGKRTESVTYVFERTGMVSILPFELTWWNLSTGQLERINLPGREFEVLPGPAAAGGGMGSGAAHGPATTGRWVAFALILAGIGVAVRVAGSVAVKWMTWRQRRRNSEAALFKRALASVGTRNPRLAVRDIMRWLDHLAAGPSPAQITGLARCYGNPAAQAAIEALLESVAAGAPLAEPGLLGDALKLMRRRKHAERKTEAAYQLPELNR